MNRKDTAIADIIGTEWDMFHNVNNMGGRASCQDDYPTFQMYRLTQLDSWSLDTLESYLSDLEAAEKEGRNLSSEKYARMMASTSPVEYQRIAHLLPVLDDEVLSLSEKIIQITLQWEEELAEKYPYVVQQGRPVHTTEDSPYVTSFETYLRGELLTYSRQTLERYHETVLKQLSEGINGSQITLESVVKQYGYASLQEADTLIKERSET